MSTVLTDVSQCYTSVQCTVFVLRIESNLKAMVSNYLLQIKLTVIKHEYGHRVFINAFIIKFLSLQNNTFLNCFYPSLV